MEVSLEFKIGDVFEQNELSVWVTGMLMIYNDITISSKRLAFSTNPEETFYNLRLCSAHYKEALRFLVLSRNKNPYIKEYIERSNLSKLYQEATSYSDEFFNTLEKIRNNLFHYPNAWESKEIQKTLNALHLSRDDLTNIEIGEKAKDFYAKYADEINFNLMGFKSEEEVFHTYMNTFLIKLDQLRELLSVILVNYLEDKPITKNIRE
jgi:hypothetical protein